MRSISTRKLAREGSVWRGGFGGGFDIGGSRQSVRLIGAV
jgi:hypothetical protein